MSPRNGQTMLSSLLSCSRRRVASLPCSRYSALDVRRVRPGAGSIAPDGDGSTIKAFNFFLRFDRISVKTGHLARCSPL